MNVERLGKIAIGVWAMYVVFILSLVAGGLYVIVHFIGKLW